MGGKGKAILFRTTLGWDTEIPVNVFILLDDAVTGETVWETTLVVEDFGGLTFVVTLVEEVAGVVGAGVVGVVVVRAVVVGAGVVLVAVVVVPVALLVVPVEVDGVVLVALVNVEVLVGGLVFF